MFGIEHYDIIPDGIIMGKSVGASLTLGCFMARSEIIDQAMDDYENGRISDEVLKYKAGW
jgi:4-aminobutyrate aminotransferase-like enzyme